MRTKSETCELCHELRDCSTICVGVGVYWLVCAGCRLEAERIARERETAANAASAAGQPFGAKH